MFSIVEIVFISFALAVDCFTASFALGVSHKRVRYDILFAIALSFGFFQALMPVIGWGCTMHLGEIAQSVDHWIAFGLLSYIGVKMIVDSRKDDDNSLLHKPNIVLMILLPHFIVYSYASDNNWSDIHTAVRCRISVGNIPRKENQLSD